MRIQFVQHVPFENPGAIERWARSRGHSYAVARMFAGEVLPPPDAWDWLVVMGGPMSVHDEADYPWLIEEKRTIKDAIARGKAVIGICLGAQLIAEALGARVYRNGRKEIGWFPIRWTEAGRSLPQLESAADAESVVFHWHGETFDLPEGAALLASSDACTNQAFAYGSSVFGLQFHLEMMPDNVAAIIEHCGADMTAGPYVQSAEAIVAVTDSRAAQTRKLLDAFLDGVEQEP